LFSYLFTYHKPNEKLSVGYCLLRCLMSALMSGDRGRSVVASMHWQALLWLHFAGWYCRLCFYHGLRRT